MTIQEAQVLNDRLYAFFGKKWDANYLDVIFQEQLRFLDSERAMRTIRTMQEDPNRPKTLPNLMTFLEYYHRTAKRQQIGEQEFEDCGRCINSGFILYEKQWENYWEGRPIWIGYAARCSCAKGQSMSTQIADYDSLDLRGPFRYGPHTINGKAVPLVPQLTHRAF